MGFDHGRRLEPFYARATPRRAVSCTLALVATVTLAALGASCVATPLPDPPSAHLDRMMLVGQGTGGVVLTGAAGAIVPGGGEVRVTRAAAPLLRARATVSDDGSFSVALFAAPPDVLYLESVAPAPSEHFLLALTSTIDGLVAAPSGPDGDGDRSPDAIDCAPTNFALRGRGCPALECETQADCAFDLRCFVGTCTRCLERDLCGNGVDDDCDGTVDDGC